MTHFSLFKRELGKEHAERSVQQKRDSRKRRPVEARVESAIEKTLPMADRVVEGSDQWKRSI
jgi:hypothetical protein